MVAAPNEPVIPIDNVQQLLQNALVDAGIVGIDEAIEQPVLNRAFIQVNWLLAQWARKRYLAYCLQEYSFVSTGALNYTVGPGGTINMNPRPDRIEYAFLRFLQAAGSTPVDIPLRVIPSQQDYSRIAVKQIGTLSYEVFYQPQWPLGVLYPWPVPQAGLYGLYFGFKTILPRFQSIQQKINFPPEYEAALNWCLARRLRATNQMPPDPEINQLARDALNTIRLGNTAVPTLNMPEQIVGGNRGWDYRGGVE